jgi:hypothetical protein
MTITDETVDCYNCGRSNPEWAQVCRSCGVPLRHGQSRTAQTGRYPTDLNSLISIAAVIGVIFGAVILGLFVSGLNPTDPNVGAVSPTPQPTPSPTVEATPAPTESAAPTRSPRPRLPGTITFGTALDANRQVTDPVETFTPPNAFAYSVTLPEPFGARSVENEIVKLNEGGNNIVLPRQSVPFDPAASTYGYVVGTAGDFLGQWGTGRFEWRVYVDGELAARGRFRYSEG